MSESKDDKSPETRPKDPGYHEVKDLYDTERIALRRIRDILVEHHSFRGVRTLKEEEDVMRRFTEEARNRCAEIGLVVDVLWQWETLQCLPCSLRTGDRVVFERGESCPHCGATDGERVAGSPDCSDDPADDTLYWNPRIVVLGRTEKLEEYDHDRQKHEVRSGLLDGKPGVIREDGSFREDPIRKNYYLS